MLRRALVLAFPKRAKTYYTVSGQKINPENSVAKGISGKIKATGPISVAEYMKEVLINPMGGYYMHKDVFGASGDFITSPEISQMFGEMVAIWCLNEWSKIGCPKPFQIVELGPGRGSLSADILRVFKQFDLLKGASLNLVEVSPFLSDMQAKRLCFDSKNIMDQNSVFYKEGLSHDGVPVKWFRHLDDVPNVFSILVAHEFFDALPVHQFKKTEKGYREILIDVDETQENKFRYVIAREETPMLKVLLKPNESRPLVEVSPESLVLCKKIADKLESYGGIALIADYGHDGSGTDTFRAFKNHMPHDPLIAPGTADLTADVDFAALKNAALEESNKVLVFGPVNQRDFLLKMGIEHRFSALKKFAKPEQIEGLTFGYNMITEEKQMGTRFKFLSMLPYVLSDFLKKHPVVGFH